MDALVRQRLGDFAMLDSDGDTSVKNDLLNQSASAQ
jgi:hypothetical protein